jgi:hypothetical protein
VKKILVIFFVPCLFIFQSCIEIIDDLTIHKDESGVLKYTINLSASKVRVNSILALDSLDGAKVPTISEIKKKVALFKQTLALQKGITNVQITENYTDFIFKFECNFINVNLLQEGLQISYSVFSNDKSNANSNFTWLYLDSKQLKRSVPELTTERFKKISPKDNELLKTGSYTSITRFDHLIARFDNPLSKISKDKKALMLKTNIYSLKEKQSILENTIYLISD